MKNYIIGILLSCLLPLANQATAQKLFFTPTENPTEGFQEHFLGEHEGKSYSVTFVPSTTSSDAPRCSLRVYAPDFQSHEDIVLKGLEKAAALSFGDLYQGMARLAVQLKAENPGKDRAIAMCTFKLNGTLESQESFTQVSAYDYRRDFGFGRYRYIVSVSTAEDGQHIIVNKEDATEVYDYRADMKLLEKREDIKAAKDQQNQNAEIYLVHTFLDKGISYSTYVNYSDFSMYLVETNDGTTRRLPLSILGTGGQHKGFSFHFDAEKQVLTIVSLIAPTAEIRVKMKRGTYSKVTRKKVESNGSPAKHGIQLAQIDIGNWQELSYHIFPFEKEIQKSLPKRSIPHVPRLFFLQEEPYVLLEHIASQQMTSTPGKVLTISSSFYTCEEFILAKLDKDNPSQRLIEQKALSTSNGHLSSFVHMMEDEIYLLFGLKEAFGFMKLREMHLNKQLETLEDQIHEYWEGVEVYFNFQNPTYLPSNKYIFQGQSKNKKKHANMIVDFNQ